MLEKVKKKKEDIENSFTLNSKSLKEKLKSLSPQSARRLIAAIAITGLSLTSLKAQNNIGDPRNQDKSLSNTEINGGKVSKNNIPQGFNYEKTENGKSWYKKVEDKTLKKATDNKNEKYKPSMAPDYKNWLISQLESGVSPDELIKKGYATSDGISDIVSHYNPTIKRVYTEDEPNKNNFESKAVDVESVFDGRGHRIGTITYNTVLTNDINDAGSLNYARESATITFIDDFGNISGQITIPGSEVQKYMGTTHHIDDPVQLQELIAKAKASTNYADIASTGK